MAEDTLRSDLIGDAGVSALVGTRVYANVLPEGVTLPAIAYRTVSANRIGGICLQRRVQVDYYAASYEALKEGRDAIEALSRTKHNWVYIEGPDFYEEDGNLHHQVIDVLMS